MGRNILPGKSVGKKRNTRKDGVREQALSLAAELPENESVSLEKLAEIYNLKQQTCRQHESAQAYPRQHNCRDNPTCLGRLGLEKFDKTIKSSEQELENARDAAQRRDAVMPCGLVNTGNFCYVNSFLQIFYNDPKFRRIIYDFRAHPDYVPPAPPAMNVEEVMFSLMEVMYTLQTTPFEDTEVTSVVKALRLGNEQQDAQEFTIMFLDAMDRNLPKHPNGEPLRARMRARMAGMTTQHIECACGRDSRSNSATSSLQLSIDGHKTLSAAIAAYFATEHLEDFRCDECGERGKVRKRVEFTTMPPVLLLQLNRYVFDMSGRNKKLTTPLQYPRKLPLKTLNPAVKNSDHYELCAVMIHEGANTNCGHYYDLVRHPELHEWFKYNDESVTQIKDPGVEKEGGSSTKASADQRHCYGLVYRLASEMAEDGRVSPPPAELTSKWDEEVEEGFRLQTGEAMEAKEQWMQFVKHRHEALKEMLARLEVRNDKLSVWKRPRDVAFLPTRLLSDILEKEFEVVEQKEKTKEKEEKEKKVEEGRGGRKPRNAKSQYARSSGYEVSVLLGSYEMRMCAHKRLAVDQVLCGEVKAVQRSAAEALLSQYRLIMRGGGQRMHIFTAEDLCEECVRGLNNESQFKERLEEKAKLADKILKDTSRCSTNFIKTGASPPPGKFYVAKKCLKEYRKLALKQFEYECSKEHDSPVSIDVISNEMMQGLSVNVTTRRGRRKREEDKEHTPSKMRKEGEKEEPMEQIGEEQKSNGVLEESVMMVEEEQGTTTEEMETSVITLDDDEDVKPGTSESRECSQEVKEEVGGVVGSILRKLSTEEREQLEQSIMEVEEKDQLADAKKEEAEDSATEVILLEPDVVDMEDVHETKTSKEKSSTKSRSPTIELSSGDEGPPVLARNGQKEENGKREAKEGSAADACPSSVASSAGSDLRPIKFNEELQCEHGGVNVNEFRHLVSADEWRDLHDLFSLRFAVRTEAAVCGQCNEGNSEYLEQQQGVQRELRHLGQQFSDLLRTADKRRPADPLYTHAVCGRFVARLRIACNSRKSRAEVPSICEECCVCEHGLPFTRLAVDGCDLEGRYAPPPLVPITQAEWTAIAQHWKQVANGYHPSEWIIHHGKLVSSCDECVARREQEEKERQYVYSNADIYVKLQDDEATPGGTGEEGVAEAVTTTTMLSSTRTTTRRNAGKNLIKVKLDSCRTVLELKQKLYLRTKQSPADQLVYSKIGGELLDNQLTLQQAGVKPDNMDEPLILVVQTQASSSGGGCAADEPREIEKGFTDTALAH